MRPSLTDLRKNILEIIENSDTPLMAKTIHEKMGKKPDLSTIYRALDYFLNKKMLSKIHLNHNVYFFYSSGKLPGHFMICQKCNRIDCFDFCPAKTIEDEIENRFGFTISDHLLQFTGICSKCSREGKK